MKRHSSIPALLFFLSLFALPAGLAALQASSDGSAEPFRVPEEIRNATEPLRFDLTVDHFDRNGYPESRTGQLVVKSGATGVVVPTRQDVFGALLLAQFVTQQRDAVILAREGSVSDPLPDGSAFEIPFGFGALRMNTSYVSLVEGYPIPHVSDNRKAYEVFPLQDLSVGGSFGITGLSAELRYTYTEQYALRFSIGSTVFGSLIPDGPLGYYRVPVHFGAGYRTPGLLEQVLGKNMITAGLDFFAGFGDGDEDASTPGFFWLPGVFVDLEKFSFARSKGTPDFRTDPRPFNYLVDSVFVRLAVYLNTVNPFRSGALVVDLQAGFLLNVIGPRIPSHEYKETQAVYLSGEYREDIERQRARKAEREKASGAERNRAQVFE